MSNTNNETYSLHEFGQPPDSSEASAPINSTTGINHRFRNNVAPIGRDKMFYLAIIIAIAIGTSLVGGISVLAGNSILRRATHPVGNYITNLSAFLIGIEGGLALFLLSFLPLLLLVSVCIGGDFNKNNPSMLVLRFMTFVLASTCIGALGSWIGIPPRTNPGPIGNIIQATAAGAVGGAILSPVFVIAVPYFPVP